MSDITEGFLLKAPQSAPSNARRTTGADSGVSRAHKDMPVGFGLPGSLVELAADQYRCAVLNAPNGAREYLLWAANSSNLAVLEDPSWVVDTGTGSIPRGNLVVDDAVTGGTRRDGTDRLVLVDDGGRTIAGVTTITIQRGDSTLLSPIEPIVVTSFADVNVVGGVITLTSATLTLLGGGLSQNRGDSIVSVGYYLAAQRFWWARNDPQTTRFAWDGTVQKWMPIKGGSTTDLGALLPSGSYTLSPQPTRYEIGQYLPGSPTTSDRFASVRVGRVPDAASGVPARVLVVSDEDIANPAYVWPADTDAIVSRTSGVLLWYGSFISDNAGATVWYSPDDFVEGGTGAIGALLGAADNRNPRFISPIPDRGEYPFVRIGNRTYLNAVGVDTDAELAGLAVSEGSVGWSRTTGKLKWNQNDVDRADPSSANFDPMFLGAVVYYDGVALSEQPLATKDPVPLLGGVVSANNDMHIPLANFETSGIEWVPDGTGTLPNNSIAPQTRANGSGLIRQVRTDAGGDAILFARSGAVANLEVVEFEDELPVFDFAVAQGTAIVAQQADATGSKIALGNRDRRTFQDEQLYFLQADVQPATWASAARMGSQLREPFQITGSEVLAIRVNGSDFLWSAATLGAGSWSADAVAASVNTLLSGAGTAYALRGRVWLEAEDAEDAGSEVCIGFGSITSGAFADRDLSGCAALGFLPGWRAAGTGGWLPDAGLSFGMQRSKVNIDRTGSASDFRATYRVRDSVVAKRVLESPMVSLTNPPLEDVAGYDDGVFFVLKDDAFNRYLRPYEELVYRFESNRMLWVEQGFVSAAVNRRIDTLPLGASGVVGASLTPALGSGYGLYLSRDGGAQTLLAEGTNYLLPDQGGQGLALLTRVLGAVKATGAKGLASDTEFTDLSATFITDGVVPGDLLRLVTGGARAQGVYVVVAVDSEQSLTVVANVPFPVSGVGLSWDILQGYVVDDYDPALVVGAGEVRVPFDALGSEVFYARVLTGLGATPADASAQSTARLRGDIADALSSGRAIAVRFGSAVGGAQADVTLLKTVLLGVVGGAVSRVPYRSDIRFSAGAFVLTLGDKDYVSGVDLLPVSVFTSGLSGDVVEYGAVGSAIVGDLNFGATVLSERGGARVYYRETFLDPVDVPAGVAECDPVDGALNLSTVDMAAHAGVEAYLVEILVPQTDTILGPVQGTVFLRKPMRALQTLEVQYERAVAGSGALYIDPATKLPVTVVEQLPLFVRLEQATRVDARTYAFNPSGRLVRSDIEAAVWVGPRLLTTGNQPRVVVDFAECLILFEDDVQAGARVQVNYAVTQAFGGEQSYTVSAPPVWRPPLIIPAGSETFTARGDRVSELTPGALFVVGPVVYYIVGAVYDSVASTTTVTVWPPSPLEAGTRDPGAASGASATTGAISTFSGFWREYAGIAYTPVDRGQLSIQVQGDITEFARVNHVLELGGVPALITAATLGPGGIHTDIRVSGPFQRGFDPSVDALRISVRPIYDLGARTTEGARALVDRPYAEHSLIRFGLRDSDGPLPGQYMVEGQDYTVDTGTGSITLLSAVEGLRAEDRLTLLQTQTQGVQPFYVAGMEILPTYSARYVYETTPSNSNGYKGGTLVARYTFRSPDAFFLRTVSMSAWMGEVQADAAAAVESSNPHGGPSLTIQPPSENKDFGTAPFNTRRRNLSDKDWAARRFISMYNDLIVGFEQVLEAIDGRVIGDRDGKFRFYVGRGKTYAPAGWEDEITGSLTARNLWSMTFEAANDQFGVSLSDPLVEPTTAVQDPTTLEVTGDPMDPDRLDWLLSLQKPLILNDLDDVQVTGGDGVRLHRDPGDILPRFDVVAGYRAMWEPSALSRVFPETAWAFGTTYPGIGYDPVSGDPGEYAFRKTVPPVGKQILPRQASTFFKEILPVENPAFGRIRNVEGALVRKRLARGRVVAFSPTGFPALDISFLINPRPAAIVAQVDLSQFPINPATGLADLARLVAGGGDTPDLTTGDAALSTPPWSALSVGANILPQIGYGRPDGSVYQLGFAGAVVQSIFGPDTPEYPAVYVDEVLKGCIVTFAWNNDGVETSITDAGALVVVGPGAPGSTSAFEPALGDTLFLTASTGGASIGTADPPSLEDVSKGVANSPLYRTGFDVGLANRAGKFRDISLPTFLLPLQQLTGQNPVEPVVCLEASVDFTNNRASPFIFPALKGESTNDSGDYTIPYLSAPNTELDRLVTAQGVFSSILETDSPLPGAVYPDEVLGADGEVLAAATGSAPPAALVSALDFTPVASAGAYTPHSGVGDVRPFDLLLIDGGATGIPSGATGILHVGAVDTHVVEPPRFISATRDGDTVGYTLAYAMVSAAADGLSGVIVSEVGTDTLFDISSIGGLFFNDGSGLAQGGLNAILDPSANPFPNGNKLTLDVIDPTSGSVIETVTLEGGAATGGAGGALITATATATNKILTVPATGFVSFPGLGGVSPGPVGPFDFRLSVDTINPFGIGVKGSRSAYIAEDRLTFVEALDLRTAQPRGAVHPANAATDLACALSVWSVQASGVASLVNSPLYVNGGPLTFLARSSIAPDVVGTFDIGTGRGTLRAMGFEGDGNTAVLSTAPFTFAAIPTSDQDADGDILTGTADVTNDANWLAAIGPTTGSLNKVQSGDVVVITQSALGDAAVTSGTYVVHHAVPDAGSGYMPVSAAAGAGTTTGWLRIPFPTILGASLTSLNVTIDGMQVVRYSDTGFDWASTGRVYVLSENLARVVSMAYTGFVGTVFTLQAGSALGAAGAAITDAEFFDVAMVGAQISGASYIPLGAIKTALPLGNVVADMTGTVFGFVATAGGVTFDNRSGGTLVPPVVAANGIAGYPTTAPSVDDLAVLGTDGGSFPPQARNEFVANPYAPVYENVPLFLDMRGLFDPASGWSLAVHGASAAAVRCLAPGDFVYSYNTSLPSGSEFRALSGIFVEPSVVRAVRDLSNGLVKVVDAGHSGLLSNGDLGMPSPSLFLATSPEQVSFTVRRLRRWHSVLDGIGSSLSPLKYVYEIRTGTVASYTGATRLLEASGATGTTIGAFNDPDVNVNPGDVVRLLDATGHVVDSAEIAAVVDGVTLKLRRPGLQEATPVPGQVFQVFVRQAPVPHKQSNEQLLDLITDQVVITRTSDPSMSPISGGYVDEFNKLLDGDVPDFAAAGVKEGDVVIVPPAGLLRGPTGVAVVPEHGARPEGDVSVSSRTVFVAGKPSELDDNRGFYRVLSVGAELEVSDSSAFGGSASAPVVYGATGQEYAVLPTISGSTMSVSDNPTAPYEAQQGLRPTRPAGTFTSDPNSYAGGSYSVGPFSYRVIRPTSTVSEDTVDLVLFIHERMSSWVEEMESAYNATKQGSYYIFQRDEHVSDLGSPASAIDGKGVPSNVYITSLSGLTGVSPFVNTSDCLSILDRRYWCLDYRLDSETPPYQTPPEPYASFALDNSSGGVYTVGSGRPVEPDRIDDVLDRTDRLRSLRASWVRYRAHRVTGTLPAIARLSEDEATASRAADDLANLKKNG